MLKKDNIHKVLEIFFDDPLTKDFQLREISRIIDLAPKSVKIYLDKLEENKLIIKHPHRIHNYSVYQSNRDNNYFKFLKKLNNLQKIEESELLDYLEKECMPEVIILFGSTSKGEDVKNSDIDLYLQCSEKTLNLNKYEKKLNRVINLFFEKDFNKLSEELKNNLINGYKLKGYLRLKT